MSWGVVALGRFRLHLDADAMPSLTSDGAVGCRSSAGVRLCLGGLVHDVHARFARPLALRREPRLWCRVALAPALRPHSQPMGRLVLVLSSSSGRVAHHTLTFGPLAIDRGTMTPIPVDEAGVRPVADPADIRSRIGQGAFLWLDLVGVDTSVCPAWLSELGLDAADVAWAMRFGQTGRMLIGRRRLRVATWIAAPEGALIELHLLGCAKGLATVWDGDPAILERIRRQFTEHAASFQNNFYLAAGNLAATPTRNARPSPAAPRPPKSTSSGSASTRSRLQPTSLRSPARFKDCRRSPQVSAVTAARFDPRRSGGERTRR